MARINIDIGTLGNPATGDTLRTAMTKINNNFAEVYSLVQDGSSGLIATDVTNGDLKLQANGTGSIEIDNLSITGDTITTIATNGSVDINGNGTGGVNIEALHFNGTSINSADSSRINLNESVTVDGDLLVTGSISGTFTVSSLDADSSTVSNLEVDNFKASAIVIESEGIGSNDNDTTIPTSAAVKDYVDTNAGTGTFTFSGNTISGPSNADVEITPGGTGNVNLNGDTVRVGDNNTDATITTQGTGDLTLSTNGGTNSGTIKIADGTNGDITLDTDGTGDVLLKGNRVGIGTVNQPDTLLHLKDTNAVITLQRTADANTPGLSFQNSNGNVRGVIKLDGTSGTSNEIFMQTYDGSSQAERFRVTHTGAKVSGTLNVDDGISITDNTITSSVSNANLELSAAGSGEVTTDTNFKLISGTPFLKIQRTDNANVPGIDFVGQAGTSGAKILFDGTSGVSNEVIFQTFDGSSLTESFRVQRSGAKVTGTLDVDGGVSITDNTITSSASNDDLELKESGTGSVSIDGIQISGTEISSSDSTQVTIKENLHVTGNISGTITGTVATIDADSTTVSNLEVDNFKASAIVTEDEGIGSNDNDTTIPTSAAVKDYVDNNATTSLAADNLTIGDAAVTITTTTGDITLDTQGNNRDIIFKGTDGGVDITPLQIDMSEGGKAIFQADIQGQGVTISDNKITSNRSNDNLELQANGTGTVVLENLKVGTGATVTTILDEDNMSTNSATALATQQSIKAYVDSEISGVSGGSTGDLTISGSTISAPSNADLTLNAGGTGSVDIDGIQIKGTTLSSTDSTQININENVSIDGTLTVSGSPLSGTLNTAGNTGTGSVALASESLQVLGTTNEINVDAAAFALSLSLADNISGIVSVTASSFLANDAIKIVDNQITGLRSNDDIILDPAGTGTVVVNGNISATDVSATNVAGTLTTAIQTNITRLGNLDYLNVDNISINGNIISQTGGSNLKIMADTGQYIELDNRIRVQLGDISQVESIQVDEVTISDNNITTNASNANLELSANGTGGIIAQSPFTFNAGYIEKINTLTSSATITVNCALASIHKVTLATSTEFNISNLPTGGTVTLIITQDGSGSRTATFGTDGSTAVKFPGGAPTLSTGAADIDVVTIVNDGTNFLGNCAKNYS